MNLNLIYLLSILTILNSCGSKSIQSNAKKHVFYLHGRIIEEQGRNAQSEKYGKYEFDNIISAFKDENIEIHYEIRKENVDTKIYSKKISKQVDSLIESGVEPINITVMGASKGAIIASNVSAINRNNINYILLAGNNEYQEQNNNWQFHGQVLCIYDLSDEIAGKNYNYWIKKENYTTTFKQLELKTNLGHGFLYKPLTVWTEPAKKWILKQEL